MQVPVGAFAQSAPDVVWSQPAQYYFVSPVAISPDGELVASSGPNNTIRLASLASGATVRLLAGHTERVASLSFSPDGTMLASTADDRTLRLWDISTGMLLRTILQGGLNRQFTASTFHPDGQHVAADRNRTNVVLWNVSDATPVWETLGNRLEIQSIACSPDGLLIAAAGGYRGGDVQIRIIRASDGQLLQSLTTSNTYGVRQLAFSPNGKWLAAGCDRLTSFNGSVEIWGVADWTRVRSLPVYGSALAFSPDGRLLVTLSANAMDFWKMPEGILIKTLDPPTGDIYSQHLSIVIAPQSDRIVTGNARYSSSSWESSTVAIRFPVILGIPNAQSNAITLNWMGGYPLYQTQRRLLNSSLWQNIGGTISNRIVTLPLDGPGAMFRVITSNP